MSDSAGLSPSEVVRRWLEFRRRDQEGGHLLAPGVVIEEPESLPYGGRFVGPEGLATMHEIMRATWRIDFPSAGEMDILECGATAVLRGHLRAESVRTGRRVETPVAEFYEVRDGLIYSIRVHYMDTALMVAALTE